MAQLQGSERVGASVFRKGDLQKRNIELKTVKTEVLDDLKCSK